MKVTLRALPAEAILNTMFPLTQYAHLSPPFEDKEEWMNRVKERENTLSSEWLARLPLFVRLIQMQELMHYAQYLDDPDEEVQGGLRYKIRCIEDDIPYMGFFDPLFSPDNPFML